MKIRNRFLIKIVAFLGAFLVRFLISTVRYKFYHIGPDIRPASPGLKARYIYVFWHENILLLAPKYGRPDVSILISQHADGELISQVCTHLGWRSIRGSTTRGGMEAVRQMLREGRDSHLVITPDGPRGPRRQLQQGLVYLASRTGMPVVLAGVAYRNAWRMRSWDRFGVPKPFSQGACIAAEPIHVPPELERDQLEQIRQQMEVALNALTDEAQRWVDEGMKNAPALTSLSPQG